MSLKRLSVQNLRNLANVDLEPAKHLNIIYGANGSGKTSLLEAISILSLGRSFRSRKIKSLICNGTQALTVFGRIDADGIIVPVGVTRDNHGGGQIKLNGNLVSTASTLSEHLPVQVMNGQSFQLLDGPPQTRRQFMDWLVFHVEQNFFPAWKDVQRLLKQRNSILRRGKIDPMLLASWDAELARKAESLDQFRQDVFLLFVEQFYGLVNHFIAIDGLQLNYYRGWDREQTFAEVLRIGFDRDAEAGYTRLGPHRAELRITIMGHPAAEVLSRGQQKLLVSALHIAQGLVFQQITGRSCIYLIDDLQAELDRDYRKMLASWLDKLGCQVFVTGVEREVLLDAWGDTSCGDGCREQKVFHVEQGVVNVCA